MVFVKFENHKAVFEGVRLDQGDGDNEWVVVKLLSRSRHIELYYLNMPVKLLVPLSEINLSRTYASCCDVRVVTNSNMEYWLRFEVHGSATIFMRLLELHMRDPPDLYDEFLSSASYLYDSDDDGSECRNIDKDGSVGGSDKTEVASSDTSDATDVADDDDKTEDTNQEPQAGSTRIVTNVMRPDDDATVNHETSDNNQVETTDNNQVETTDNNQIETKVEENNDVRIVRASDEHIVAFEELRLMRQRLDGWFAVISEHVLKLDAQNRLKNRSDAPATQ